MSDQMSPVTSGFRPLRDAAGPVHAGPAPGTSSEAAQEIARAFEAAFLGEMLKHAGFGEAPEGFGGGAGEDQFAGFLRQAQAREMAAAGGIGIAEYVLRTLVEEPGNGARDDRGT